MGISNLILLLAAEAFAFCLFVIALLALKCRQLLRINRELTDRLAATNSDSAANIQEPAQTGEQDELLYIDHIDEQLEFTQDYHQQLDAPHDIVLDLDPDTPSKRRTPALRFAFLLAEKEAIAADPTTPNWVSLEARYQQLLDFQEDYQPQQEDREEATKLRKALEEAHSKIDELQRFKALYEELETTWGECKQQANEHYAELQSLAGKSQDNEALSALLDDYHHSYADLEDLMPENTPQTPTGDEAPDQFEELKRLRSVTADQHRIIQKLQEQLSSTASNEEKTTLINQLQHEVQKQVRYLTESETCIKLMEDELASANKQIQRLRNKASEVVDLKTTLRELRGSAETRAQVVESLQAENRSLNRKLEKMENDSSASPDTEALRKELSALQARYTEMEEKFLNSKLKE